MTHKGPPPPPPAPKGPPPPPKGPAAKGPPPPPGAKGAAVPAPVAAVSLTTLSMSEKQAWVKNKSGLDLNALTLNFYPDKDFLIDAGISEEKASKSFTDDEKPIKERLQQRMREKVEALLNALFQLEEATAAPYLTALEAKVKNWKPTRDADGLSNCYKFLMQNAQKWRKVAGVEQKAVISPDDPLFPLMQKSKGLADELQAQYDTLLTRYTNQQEGDEKTGTFTKMQAVIASLKKQRDTIKSVAPQVEEGKKAVTQAQGKRNERLKKIEEEIARLTEETEKLRAARDPRGEKKVLIQQNAATLEKLNQELTPQASAYQTEQIEIDKARLALQEAQAKHEKVQAIQSLFDPPESWREISSKPRKAVVLAGQKAKQRDTTGMVQETQALQSLAFDIQFLPMRAIENLARFFASDPSEELAFLKDRFGLYALMAKINSKTALNEVMNFKYLMDIAEGRIIRPVGVYPVDADFFKAIDVDISVNPNYAELLLRSNRHHNVREEKKGVGAAEQEFNIKTFEKYSEERGITVTPFTPPRAISKERKEYHYNRKIDLSYLNPPQMLNLANFFSRKPDEFLTLGAPDNNAISLYVNELFNHSGLSFEEVISIAAGHLIRQPGKFADKDPRYALAYDVETKGNSPDFNAFIQQRADYITEQKRLAAQAREAEQQRQLQEKEKARAEKGDLAKQKLAEITNSYKKLYKISDIDMEDEAQREAFQFYVSAQLNKESDPQIKELIREQLGLGEISAADLVLPRAASESDSRSVSPLSTTSAASSATSSPRSEQSPRARVAAVPTAETPAAAAAAAAATEPTTTSPIMAKRASQLNIRQSPPPIRLSRQSVAPAPAEGKTRTGLGLDKAAMVTLKNSNAPSKFEPLMAKAETFDKGRQMEAISHAVNFLLSPDTTNLTQLFEKAHRSNVWYGGKTLNMEELNALQEFCMQLNFTEKLHPEDPRQYQNLLGIAAHKTTTVQFDWLTKIKEKPHLRAFLDQVNQKTEHEPYYKLLVLKGYLYDLQSKYGDSKQSLQYKMGALCQHLLDTIDHASLVNVPAERRSAAEILLNRERCVAEFTKFMIDFNVNKKEDEPTKKGRAKPAQH